ncbi:hypothetical protein, partial [Kordia jejudonensis]|uniref:hypothetical protein n=1 Tax=Kordia jejudonensis TaxID=1348245 RepID=UPI0006296970
RNLKSLQLNKIAISSLKGGESVDETANCYETYSCEENVTAKFCQKTLNYNDIDCPSIAAPYTGGLGCVPHGPSVAGDC